MLNNFEAVVRLATRNAIGVPLSQQYIFVDLLQRDELLGHLLNILLYKLEVAGEDLEALVESYEPVIMIIENEVHLLFHCFLSQFFV